MSFQRVGFHPSRILLPAPSVAPETWACVACDQYTSEPAYWEKADRLVDAAPSALRLILPECYLAESSVRVPKIHETMRSYLDQGILTAAVENGFVLCERTIASGVRLGLVGAVDLEAYSFDRAEKPLVRPTEQTITSRLPPRLAIRRGAPVELTHIMILVDDPERTVLEPLAAKKADFRRLYDFELMLDGGHLTGYAVEGPEALSQVDRALNSLLDRKKQEEAQPMLLAVGDGNHSLATAKALWEEIKPGLSETERETHPARYALCEIVNIHDEALRFEPIHRYLTGVDRFELLADWTRYAEARGMTLKQDGVPEGTAEAHCFTLVSRAGEENIAVIHPEGAIPCETVQKFLDDFLARHPDAEIDYIHGEASLRTLAERQETVGILLPPIDKNRFFRDVIRLGVLPRKTFSMGEANEKRYYMEARAI